MKFFIMALFMGLALWAYGYLLSSAGHSHASHSHPAGVMHDLDHNDHQD